MNYNWKFSFSYSQVIEKIWWKKLFQRKPMLDMQEKSGSIHETNVTKTDQPTKTITTTPATPATIIHREGIHILATDSNRITSQMTKSQTTMVNEATCSPADHTINSNKNSITNDLTNMSTITSISSHATDQSQPHSQQQQQPQHQSYSNVTNNANMATTNSNNTRPTRRTANDYRFGKTIGEGSFSSVYIAQDIHTKKEVASKFNLGDRMVNSISSYQPPFNHAFNHIIILFLLQFQSKSVKSN